MNILLIMVDQWRADYIGALGNGRCRTPQLDRLAGRGCLFTRAVTPHPVCQAARAALLTGRHPHQICLATQNGDLRADVRTVPQALQAAGYHTALIGKLHVNDALRPDRAAYPEYREAQRDLGFDHIWECAGKELVIRRHCDWSESLAEAGYLERYRRHLATARSGGYLKDTPLADRWRHHPWPLPEALYVDNQIGERAQKHLREIGQEQPFFLQVSFCGPHPPYDPPAGWLEGLPPDPANDLVGDPGTAFTDEERRTIGENRRAYRGMIAGIDAWIGRLLDVLDERGLADDTMVAFCSDHGEMLGDHRRYNKQVAYWQSSRIPLIVALPGSGCRRHEGMVELTDLSTTILDGAGLTSAVLDRPGWSFHDRIPGRSLLPVVRGETGSPVREFAISIAGGVWTMCESRDFKLVREREAGRTSERLWDLSADPDERIDRADDHRFAPILSAHRMALLDFLESTPPCQERRRV